MPSAEALSTEVTEVIDRELGRNIRGEMGRHKVTMVELSRRTGVRRTTLAYQIDVGSVSAATLMLIAAALGLDVADLLPEP